MIDNYPEDQRRLVRAMYLARAEERLQCQPNVYAMVSLNDHPTPEELGKNPQAWRWVVDAIRDGDIRWDDPEGSAKTP